MNGLRTTYAISSLIKRIPISARGITTNKQTTNIKIETNIPRNSVRPGKTILNIQHNIPVRELINKEIKRGSWGMILSMNIYQANKNMIRNDHVINNYTTRLASLLFTNDEEKRYFISEDAIRYSIVRDANSSHLIIGQFNTQGPSYVDIFSSSPFHMDIASLYTESYFHVKLNKFVNTSDNNSIC